MKKLLIFMCTFAALNLIQPKLQAETVSTVLLENFKTTLLARQPGEVRINAKEGVHVAKDELLFEIGTDNRRLKLQLASLQHQKAQARLNKLKTPKTEKELELAKLLFEQKKRLFDAGAISSDAFEIIRLEYELEIHLPREEDVAIASMEVEERRLDIEILKKDLNQAISFAAEKGQITKIYVQNDEWVIAGQKVMDLIVTNPLFIALNIPLKNLKNFSADQKLETQINTGGSISPAEGIVAYIIDELDGVDQVGRILIKINNDEYLFKPGMHVKVVLP